MRRRTSKRPVGIKPELLSALAAVDFEAAASAIQHQARASTAESEAESTAPSREEAYE